MSCALNASRRDSPTDFIGWTADFVILHFISIGSIPIVLENDIDKIREFDSSFPLPVFFTNKLCFYAE